MVDTGLAHALADGLDIAEVAKLHAGQPSGNALQRSAVTKTLQPNGELQRLSKLKLVSTLCDIPKTSTKSDTKLRNSRSNASGRFIARRQRRAWWRCLWRRQAGCS
jgi:hypothetical protein